MKAKFAAILLSITCLPFTTTTAQANDFDSIIQNLYGLEDMLRNNQRRITRASRRGNMAADINQIIQDAQIRIQQRIDRRGGGRGNGRVDVKLVEVAIKACGNLGTWDSRRSCFDNYLQGTRGLLGSIANGCSAINSDQGASTCYANSLNKIKGGERDINRLTVSACGSLGTWDARKTCFDQMTVNSFDNVSSLLSSSCAPIRQEQASSTCYANGFSAAQNNLSEVKIALNACSKLGTWDARAVCFKSAVVGLENLGIRVKRYVRRCYNMNSDSQTAQCFTRGLETL